MLEHSLVASRPPARTRKPLTVLLSAITHSGLVVALILIPLFQTPILPQIASLDVLQPPQVQVTRIVAVPPPDAPRPAAPPRIATDLIAPTEIPKQIAVVNDDPVDTAGFLPSMDGIGGGNDLLIRLLGTPGMATPVAIPPPPAPSKPPVAATPEPEAPTPPAPLRVAGGQLEKSHLIHQVTPGYPPLAKQIRLEGTVIVEAVITREGTIDSGRIRVISGHDLLSPAAVDAIKQWQYRPTMLNGQAVEIITTITISFRLQ